MKKLLFSCFLLFGFFHLQGQAVGISEDNSIPNAKSILDIKSTTKGMLAPRMNTMQRLAIGAGVTEEGMIVFDTDLNKYMMYTGSAWEIVGDGLWLTHTNGAYRLGRTSVGGTPQTNVNLFIHNSAGVGPDTSVLYALRSGSSNSAEGGSNFTVSGIDAGIKTYAFWGNTYSTGLAAYSFLDYNHSSALLAGKNDASVLALLAYKESASRTWAGHFTGDVRISGQMGVGITPNSVSLMHVQTDDWDRTGYFFNNKVTTNITYGIYAGAYGTGSGAKRAAAFEAIGGTGINIAMRATAQGGSTNWSGYFADGNVYVADNVSIGTENMATGYLLNVNGRIISEELRIQDMLDWPDYVFDEDYPLMDIYEVEKTIQQHHHLPGVPSASEVAEDGILLGEMQKVIMKKIEELTLYTIAQQKQIDSLQAEINLLNSRLAIKHKRKSVRSISMK